MKYDGTKCTTNTLIQLLLIAASRAVSIFAACRDLADAPCDQTIRNALDASLPGVTELQRRLNRALATELPKALFRTQGVFVLATCSDIRRRPALSTFRTINHWLRKSRRIAIDLVLIPYHGHPYQDEKEILVPAGELFASR